MTSQATTLAAAARNVLDSWESGDLGRAVQGLAVALSEFEAAPQQTGERELAARVRNALRDRFGDDNWPGADVVQFLCDWMAANNVDPDGTGETCDECGVAIPGDVGSIIGPWHETHCSANSASIAGIPQPYAALPFAIDEAGARQWLDHVAAVYVGEAAPAHPAQTPDLGAAWKPLDPDEEPTVFRLVRYAVELGIITAPEGMDLDWEYMPDGDGGYYRFLVYIGDPVPWMRLASHAEEMRKLGARDATGVPAALAILQEAVTKANRTLADLDKYLQFSRPGIRAAASALMATRVTGQ
jgi:hypothetical protein